MSGVKERQPRACGVETCGAETNRWSRWCSKHDKQRARARVGGYEWRPDEGAPREEPRTIDLRSDCWERIEQDAARAGMTWQQLCRMRLTK
ncbi:MAG: hypothetical protein ACYC9X_00770 [Dehalococcoidia bacterium]